MASAHGVLPRRERGREKMSLLPSDTLGICGRRTGLVITHTVHKDDDFLDNVDDFFLSSDDEAVRSIRRAKPGGGAGGGGFMRELDGSAHDGHGDVENTVNARTPRRGHPKSTGPIFRKRKPSTVRRAKAGGAGGPADAGEGDYESPAAAVLASVVRDRSGRRYAPSPGADPRKALTFGRPDAVFDTDVSLAEDDPRGARRGAQRARDTPTAAAAAVAAAAVAAALSDASDDDAAEHVPAMNVFAVPSSPAVGGDSADADVAHSWSDLGPLDGVDDVDRDADFHLDGGDDAEEDDDDDDDDQGPVVRSRPSSHRRPATKAPSGRRNDAPVSSPSRRRAHANKGQREADPSRRRRRRQRTREEEDVEQHEEDEGQDDVYPHDDADDADAYDDHSAHRSAPRARGQRQHAKAPQKGKKKGKKAVRRAKKADTPPLVPDMGRVHEDPSNALFGGDPEKYRPKYGTPGNDRTPGVRRSSRRRYAPLQYWRGERVVYEREEGEVVPSVAKVYRHLDADAPMSKRAHQAALRTLQKGGSKKAKKKLAEQGSKGRGRKQGKVAPRAKAARTRLREAVQDDSSDGSSEQEDALLRPTKKSRASARPVAVVSSPAPASSPRRRSPRVGARKKGAAVHYQAHDDDHDHDDSSSSGGGGGGGGAGYEHDSVGTDPVDVAPPYQGSPEPVRRRSPRLSQSPRRSPRREPETVESPVVAFLDTKTRRVVRRRLDVPARNLRAGVSAFDLGSMHADKKRLTLKAKQREVRDVCEVLVVYKVERGWLRAEVNNESISVLQGGCLMVPAGATSTLICGSQTKPCVLHVYRE